MTLRRQRRQAGAEEASVDVADLRRAQWLQSNYPSPVWTVADTLDPANTATIDFRVRLADGRLLTDVPRLYATVKEYAWWVRDPRFSRIDDAKTHASMVRNLMMLAHALSYRGIISFAHLQAFDVLQLTEDCRYGADAVLQASARVNQYLQALAAANDEKAVPFGGIPRYVIPATGAVTPYVHSAKIVEACHLPASAAALPGVAALIAKASKGNGLRPRARQTDAHAGEPLANVTVQALQRWLDPLEQLYAMRRHITAEAIGFKPFPYGAARTAAIKGVGVSRTGTPPPKLALHLLSKSADWVLRHSGPNCVNLDERQQILRAATACWILIAAFSARRDEEIDDLTHDCLRGDDESGWWLHTFIEKTLMRREWIPIPAVVARAVHLMQSISATAREATASDRLFQWLSPAGDLVRINVGRSLDDFAKIVDVPLHSPSGGETSVAWHWHPHQFRRFFAILYFYRFEGATIEALSHHLRHFSLEMTKRYVTMDPEVAALWTDVEWGYMGHVARSIVAGERSVSGASGEHLKRATRRLIDIFRRKLQVVTPERVGAALTQIMQRKAMVLTPKPWVLCTCPRTHDAAKTAACRREVPVDLSVTGPDFARAGPTVCPHCPNAMTDAAHLTSTDEEINYLDVANSSDYRANTLFGALERARVVELRHVRDIATSQAAR